MHVRHMRACWEGIQWGLYASTPVSDAVATDTGSTISTHWLRHTTLTWMERHFGYGIARAYAGHTDSTGAATTTYIQADLQAVAAALAAMTGQPHPLATTTLSSPGST